MRGFVPTPAVITDDTERVEAAFWGEGIEVGTWVRVLWGAPRWEHGVIREIRPDHNGTMWANVEVRCGRSSTHHIMSKVGVTVLPPTIEKVDHPRWANE